MRDTAYQAQVQKIRAEVHARVARAWTSLPDYRDRDIDRFVSTVVPLVQGGQIQVANLTAAYFEAGLVDRDLILAARGIPAGEVYRRPATTLYTALANGKSFTEAVTAGSHRLADLAMTDLEMAKVRQADASLRAAGAKSFRRTLTGLENCALCVIASTQRYRVGDLLPIHPGCDCGVAELPASWDPEQQVIDPQLLDHTYSEIATKLDGVHDHVGREARNLGIGKTDARGRPLSDFTDLLMTREHGEYGPTLTWRDHAFTSADHIAALAR